ncbi:metallophosphoesterase family protein [Catenulispora subtropica]|uniref:Calcineurin-like phosphoesterase domain-containing protein n=1 Tax=Catenulispora subtropica TaxID=450798 RepID=A0ABN2SCT2_9ACTN
MKVAFIGDVHGCVLHALGSILMLQSRRGLRLDAVVQVGDLGAYPSADRFDGPSARHIADSPAQGDFFRLLDPTPELAASVRGALEHLPPIVFLSGNHEDHEWLAALHEAAGSDVVAVDPLGAFRHVVCGHVTEIAGLRTAFLGMIEWPGTMDYDEAAYAHLLGLEPGSVDVLVTHEGPYGMSHNRRGEVQGSPKMSRLIDHLRPPLHISGHVHHENGPRHYGPTTSYALAQLVGPKATRYQPEGVNPDQRVCDGSIGLLDTGTHAFEYLHDDWLAEVSGDTVDLDRILRGL